MASTSTFFNELVSELSTIYEREEAINIMRMVFREKLGLSRVDIALDESEIDAKSHKLIIKIAEKLMEGQPVQQLLGYTTFYGLELRVNKNVLIPRPETEELVDCIIKENIKENLHILDVGTGSGCIAIVLSKKMNNPIIKAIDISQPALELAQINALSNHADIDFSNLDILKEDNWKKLDCFDIIVSNPPYVLESEKAGMHINVLNHEPHLALFVPDSNPLLYYEKISEMALKHLYKNGKLYFEINTAYGKPVKKILIQKGFKDVVIVKDMNERDRMVKAVL